MRGQQERNYRFVNSKHLFMKQNHPKKLSLRKKAISNLSAAQMRQVNGGALFIPNIPTQLCWFTATVTCNPVTQGCNSLALTCNFATVVTC